MGGMLDEVLSMDSYKSRIAKWRIDLIKHVPIQYDYPAQGHTDPHASTESQVFSNLKTQWKSPAVMYWEGALAPEDRKAPEYLQMEEHYHKKTSMHYTK